MPQLAVAAWGAFSAAVVGNALATSAFLASAGLATGAALTIGSYAAVAYTAAQVVGGVMAVASSLGVGQKQPSLRGAWEQNRLTVDASASRKLIVGRTALSGSLRAQFQVGKYKDWFWQTIALGGAGPIESLDGVVIERVTYSINGNGQCSYAPNDMQVFFRDGAWAQSAITSFPLRNVSETPTGQWTSNHRGAGIAHVLWVARENPKVFTKGKPQPLWLVKGQTDLIDPRTGTTAGSTHRDNPAVWEYTWRLGFKSPGGYGTVELGGFQKTVDQLDTATYAAWANRCESLGWKVSGEIDLNEDREAVSRAFCQAGAAVPIVKGGKDSVFYQSVKTSLMTLTEADFVGDIEVSTSPEIRDRANGIVPRFRSEAHGWEQVAGSLITAGSYVTEDGGSRIAEIQFPLVVSAVQAGQLAAYQMVQSRERLLIRGPIHPRILAIGPGEAITINVPSRGISNVKFIMEGRSISTGGAITCTFRSETDSKHAFAIGQNSTVPDTSLPSLSDGTIDSPTSGVWTAAVAQITSGPTSIPIIRVTGAVESFRVAAVLIRYRVTTGPGPWNNLAPANRDATRIEIDIVTPNTSYDLEISYISVTGKESAWTSLGTIFTGDLAVGTAATVAAQAANLVPGSGPIYRPDRPAIAWMGEPENARWTVVETGNVGLGVARWNYNINPSIASDPLMSPLIAIEGGAVVSAQAQLFRLGTWTTGDIGAAIHVYDSSEVQIGSPIMIGWASAGVAVPPYAGCFFVKAENITLPGGAAYIRAVYDVVSATGSGSGGASRVKINRGTTCTVYSEEATNNWTFGSEIGRDFRLPDGTLAAVEQIDNNFTPRTDGVTAITVQQDFAGNALPGQLDRTFQIKRFRGTTDVTSTTTFSVTMTGGTATITSGGLLQITSTVGGRITVTTVRDGLTIPHIIEVTAINAAPPVTGGGGASTAVDTTIDPTSSGSLVTCGGPITVRAGAAGQISFGASLAYTTSSTSNSTAGARIRYRVGAGAWTWAAAEVTGTAANSGFAYELGDIDAGTVVTGLVNGTDYECELQCRRATGSGTLYFYGSFAAEAS